MAADRWSRNSLYSGLLALVGSGVFIPPALSQDGALEEVIVTARKRAESLQETPVAVTALSADALRDAGVRNLAQLNQIAPNIEVSSANGTAPLANIYIRGVGQRNTGPNIDSGVGIYIDEVYVGRPDGALLDIYDVQSVQVLRGPQGTLFGKNTTAGALVFTTNRPSDELEVVVGGRVGNYDRHDGNFVLNLPLTDTLYTRLAGSTVNRDGYIKNRYDGDKYMNEDRQNVNWQTRMVPTENLTLDLNLLWAKTKQTMRPQKCVLVPGYKGWQAELFNTLAIVPSTGRTMDDFCRDAAEAGDDNTVISDLGGKYSAKNKGASFVADWDLNQDISLKSITAWRYTNAEQDDELDHTGIPFLHRTQSEHPNGKPRKTDQYSQEFQITGNAVNDRLTYVAGLYLFREKTQGETTVSFLGPFDPALAGWLYLNTNSTKLDADNDAVASFAQLEWEWSEHWRTTLGLRYTDESRKLSRTRYQIIPDTLDANGGEVTPLFGASGLYDREPGFVYNPDFGYTVQDQTSEKTTNDDTTPMASIQYLLDDQEGIDAGTIYLTYSEGFLSGGLSEAPSGQLETFKPEEVTNWELGFKLDMLDSTLRVNGALYYTDYKNRQLTSLVINPETNSPAPATINAAKSTIKGFELETMWYPTERLQLMFNMTLNDGTIDEFDDTQVTLADPAVPPAAGCTRADLTFIQVDSCPNDRSNENLPRLPEQTYYVAAEYTFDTPIGRVIPRVQYSYKSDVDYCFDAGSCDSGLWLEGKQRDLSARINWQSRDEKWVGALYGNNLTDENYIVGGSPLVDSQGVGGFANATPTTYGVELQYRY
ncbi:MAG: TonB-dependent receptor [Pseudomonadales bacterium]|nr:TonB-dependent receptor [Pseudomonadales bacterium]MCP5187540.1 TonB-dependent receptor [Pseudomonadales bacterium]